MTEQEIQKQIIDYLEKGGYLVVKINSAGLRKANGGRIPQRRVGISDLLICSPTGRFIAIEVKKPDGKTSKEQKLFLEDVVNRGGVAIVAKSIQDVRNALNQYVLYGKTEFYVS